MKVATQKKSFPAIIILTATIGFIILFVPPANTAVILVFLFLVFSLIYSVSKLFLQKKFSFLLALFIILFLSLLAANLFDTINAVLLISLFVGIFALIK